MINPKFEIMWNLLSNGVFKFSNIITEDLICIECKKVLINAHQVPCGCKFCHKCIENYIDSANKFCPGNRDECKEEILSRKTNISVDYRTNNVISRLNTKCPNLKCNFQCELKCMNDHLLLCENKDFSESNEAGNYLDTAELISNLTNEINKLKEKEGNFIYELKALKEFVDLNNTKNMNCCVEMIKNEIIKLKDVKEKSSNDLNERKPTESNTGNVINSLKETLRKRENEIEMLNKNVDLIKKTYTDDLTTKMKIYLDEKILNFVEEMKLLYEIQLEIIRREWLQLRNDYTLETINIGGSFPLPTGDNSLSNAVVNESTYLIESSKNCNPANEIDVLTLANEIDVSTLANEIDVLTLANQIDVSTTNQDIANVELSYNEDL